MCKIFLLYHQFLAPTFAHYTGDGQNALASFKLPLWKRAPHNGSVWSEHSQGEDGRCIFRPSPMIGLFFFLISCLCNVQKVDLFPSVKKNGVDSHKWGGLSQMHWSERGKREGSRRGVGKGGGREMPRRRRRKGKARTKRIFQKLQFIAVFMKWNHCYSCLDKTHNEVSAVFERTLYLLWSGSNFMYGLNFDSRLFNLM